MRSVRYVSRICVSNRAVPAGMAPRMLQKCRPRRLLDHGLIVNS